MIMEEVILIDDQDVEIGRMEKLAAHRSAVLHRAISVFILNSKGEWLLQQRTFGKYHSKGLWSNTSCSHPAPGETTEAAAVRRLMEEMGLATKLTWLFKFTYKAHLENELTEYETDHIFVGITDALPQPDPEEVMAYRYVDFDTLHQEITAKPEQFSEWFKMLYKDVQRHLQTK